MKIKLALAVLVVGVMGCGPRVIVQRENNADYQTRKVFISSEGEWWEVHRSERKLP